MPRRCLVSAWSLLGLCRHLSACAAFYYLLPPSSIFVACLQQLEEALEAAEVRLRTVEADMADMRDRQRQAPEARLRTEMMQLKVENAEKDAAVSRERAGREAEARARVQSDHRAQQLAQQLQTLRKANQVRLEHAVALLVFAGVCWKPDVWFGSLVYASILSRSR